MCYSGDSLRWSGVAGEVRVVAETSDRCIEEPDVIARILNHLAQISARDHSYAGHPGRGPPQLDFFS